MDRTSIAIFSFSGHQYLLPFCLKSIYCHAPAHAEIVLVWDDNVSWYPIDFDQLRKDTAVDFRLVLQSEIASWTDSVIKWGWIKQQLAKLLCYQVIPSEHIWIVDGDVLLTGDPALFDDGRPVLRYQQGTPVPQNYRFFMEKYLGIRDFNHDTFVGSTCLFHRELCQEVDLLCRQHANLDILAAVDRMLTSGPHPNLPFSEFECYGHVARHHRDVSIKAHNWNYVRQKKPDWSAPIQIGWAEQEQDLNLRYQNLMRRRHPESVD